MNTEIEYFKRYKTGLDDFMYAESLNLTVIEYMEIVKETKRVMMHIAMLKT